MSDDRLLLEIVTPDGRALKEKEVDSVVFRRREKRFELGSEIAVFPLHAPTLVRIPVAPIRYRKAGRVFHLALGGGFVEIKKDQVTFVTPRSEQISSREPDPAARARMICRKWQEELGEFQTEMVGYL